MAFECQVASNHLQSSVTTLDGPQDPIGGGQITRRIVGVGTVGRTPGQATYTLYNPSSDRVTFQTICYGKGRGFAPKPAG